MQSVHIFCKAAIIRNVLDCEGHRIFDDIQRFRAFRALVEHDEKNVYDRLVMHWNAAEKISPKAGELFAKLLISENEEFLSKPVISKDDVAQLLKNNQDKNLILACYDLIGSEGSIEVVKGHKDAKNDRLDVQDTYRFDIECGINTKPITEKRLVSVVIIDGFVEQVSEIHHLLQKISESKGTLFLFARGYSPEVLNTLSVNLARETLDAYPFIVPLELGHINDMYDIALVTGCEVISSDKGQLISMVKQDRLANVPYAKYCNQDKLLMLRNETTKKSVNLHLATLRARAESTDPANLPEIMKRIRKLTSLLCVVSLKPDMRFEARHDNVRTTCRNLDFYLRYGMVTTLAGECYPNSSLAVARRHYIDVKNQLSQTVTFDIR